MSQANYITRFAIGWLNNHGHLAWRNNTVAVWDRRRNVYRRSQDRSAIGSGDVVVCFKGGRYAEIEVKAGRDKVSEAQVAHAGKITLSGGEYYVVRSQLEFLNLAISKGWDK